MVSEKGKAGRPAFEPTDEQRKNVQILISLGLPLKEICAVVRDRNDKAITEPTLRKHFAKEIEVGLPGVKRWMGILRIRQSSERKYRKASRPLVTRRAGSAC